MLEKLEFEAQTGGGQPEIRRIGVDDRGPPDMGADQPLSSGNLVSIDHALSPGIHISTLSNVSLICHPNEHGSYATARSLRATEGRPRKRGKLG
jgi:hypothetical protein